MTNGLLNTGAGDVTGAVGLFLSVGQEPFRSRGNVCELGVAIVGGRPCRLGEYDGGEI